MVYQDSVSSKYFNFIYEFSGFPMETAELINEIEISGTEH